MNYNFIFCTNHDQLNNMFGRECVPLVWKTTTEQCANLKTHSVCEREWVYEILLAAELDPPM